MRRMVCSLMLSEPSRMGTIAIRSSSELPAPFGFLLLDGPERLPTPPPLSGICFLSVWLHIQAGRAARHVVSGGKARYVERISDHSWEIFTTTTIGGLVLAYPLETTQSHSPKLPFTHPPLD